MTKITNFVWNPVDDCIISEVDETGAVQAVYTNEPQQYGGVISQRRGNTSHYHHHDALGSTRFLTDSSGNVTDTYLNDAWGNEVASTGTTVNPFKWVGKYGYYTDDSTGQVYVRARMYQPTVARWMSVDPLTETLNGYVYSLLSPLARFDLSGLSSCLNSGDCSVNRGRFEVASIGSFESEESPNRRGSTFYLKWKVDSSKFSSDGINEDCCCCSEVGVLQIYSEIVDYGKYSRGTRILGWSPTSWTIDKAVPYPNGPSPRVNPCKGDAAVQVDDGPNAPLFWRGIGYRLKGLRQQFESCIVCLRGTEALHKQSGRSTIDYPGAIYGCIRWGHSIYWGHDSTTSPDPRYPRTLDYHYKRWIGDEVPAGMGRHAGDRNVADEKKNFSGDCGSPAFKSIYNTKPVGWSS